MRAARVLLGRFLGHFAEGFGLVRCKGAVGEGRMVTAVVLSRRRVVILQVDRIWGSAMERVSLSRFATRLGNVREPGQQRDEESVRVGKHEDGLIDSSGHGYRPSRVRRQGMWDMRLHEGEAHGMGSL